MESNVSGYLVGQDQFAYESGEMNGNAFAAGTSYKVWVSAGEHCSGPPTMVKVPKPIYDTLISAGMFSFVGLACRLYARGGNIVPTALKIESLADPEGKPIKVAA